MKQRIQYVRTADDIGLAWAEAGRGMPLVKAANWLTHLEYDWESPVWGHWTRFLAGHYHFIRYDERGCGLSDWNVGDMSQARWIEDLEQVVDAAELDQPFALLGISQGAAASIAYAVRYPHRVSHLILYGGYSVGVTKGGNAEAIRGFNAIRDLMGIGWEKDNPTFRQLFTSRFIPDGEEHQIEWFNELCRRTTTAANGAALMEARGNVDVSELLAEVRVPTLIVHASRDQIVPLKEGKRLVREIPGARMVQLDSSNHILLEHESAWKQFKQVVLEFTGQADDASRERLRKLTCLTRREREILVLLCEGEGNSRIAAALGISEKTARNHLSNVYEKLGVHSRAAAIVLAYQQSLIDQDGGA